MTPAPSDASPPNDETASRGGLPWIKTLLPEGEWQARQRAHRERYQDFFDRELRRRGRGESDPTVDFLFDYYGFRPSRFLRWTPGFGVILAGDSAQGLLADRRYAAGEGGVYLTPEALPKRRRASFAWIRDLLAATAERAPFFGCHGRHEWALTHGVETLRHDFPLRVSRSTVASFLEEVGVRCTHFDALRFFSAAALALNEHPRDRELMAELEQPGCLHANMDLYRWALKLDPWVPSELLAAALDLARQARAVDSAASPYDLRATGIEPLAIETDAGRQAFIAAQREVWQRSSPIRRELLAVYEHVLRWL